MAFEPSRHRVGIGLGLLLVSLLALAVASAGEQQDEAWIDELTVGQQAGIRLDVGADPFAGSWMDSLLGLGVGTDLHLFGGDLVLHAFPDTTKPCWSSGNLRERGTDTSLVHYDTDRLREIGYLITTYVDDAEYVAWRNLVYAELDSENTWSIELEWDVDPLLANLAIFGVSAGYRVYRRFVLENEIGTVCHEDFDDLVLIEEFRGSPGQSAIVFADQGTYGQWEEGRPGIASPGSVDVDDPLGDLTIGRQLTANSIRVGSDKSVSSGCLSVEHDATVGDDLKVSDSLGVGVTAPGGAGDAEFAGSVGIANAPMAGVPLTVGDLGVGAWIDLSGGGALGRLWELGSTRLGDFSILDQGEPRLEIASENGDTLFLLGDPALPLRQASQGSFEVAETALGGGLVSRLDVGEYASVTVGADGIPPGAGQPAVGARLGDFAINDDASGIRLWMGSDFAVWLGHDTILPPPGGAAALSIERAFGSLTVSDELEAVERLTINDGFGNTAMVIGTEGLAAVLIPPGFNGDMGEMIAAINPELGTFRIRDTNLAWLDDRLRIDASGTFFHLGNPDILHPQTPGVIAVEAASGEFVITDELGAANVPRFKINTHGKVGIGLDPVGGAAGSLEVACGLGVGMASPATVGDVALAGALSASNAFIAVDLSVGGMIDTWDLLVMNDADILGDLFVAGDANVDNLDVNKKLDVGQDAEFNGNAAVAGNVAVTGNVNIEHDLNVKGRKFFVQEHPTDPTKEIAYAALEGPEAGTYVRGTAHLTEGEAVIELPESFALVTADEGLTVQVTLLDPCNGLYVVEKTTERIVVRELMDGTSDAQFDYLVQGIRAGYEDYDAIRQIGEQD